MIQKHIRGWLQRKKFLREKQAALIIQRYFRGQQTVRYVGTKEECGIVELSSPLTSMGRGLSRTKGLFPGTWGTDVCVGPQGGHEP